MAHAECSPSQLARVMNCPGSRRLLRDFKRKSSTYANEGTAAHEVIAYEVFQKYAHLCNNSIELEPNIELNQEYQEAVADALEFLSGLIEEIGEDNIAYIEIEKHGSLNWAGLPEVAGTCDVKIRTKNNNLYIIDWKFGKGIFVSAKDNTQLKAYAATSVSNASELRVIDEIFMYIVQPRLQNFSSTSVSGTALLSWVNSELRSKIYESRNPEAECVPGEEQCRWCVGTTCKARAKYNLKLAKEIFEPYMKKDKTIDDFIQVHEVAHLLDYAQTIKKFIAELSGDMITECTLGNGIPGYKVVAGRSYRKWKNEEAAIDFLTELSDDPETDLELEDCFTSKPLSVAQAEKLAKKYGKLEDFKKLWIKPPGKETLVSDSDPREAIKNSAANAFSQYTKGK